MADGSLNGPIFNKGMPHLPQQHQKQTMHNSLSGLVRSSARCGSFKKHNDTNTTHVSTRITKILPNTTC
eukprot:5375474-Ditylum_brightwellii.AAC.1